MFNPTSLNTLTRSKAFEGLATELALQHADRAWDTTIDNIRKYAAQTIIWEAHQRIALLFDVYGPAMREVCLSFDKGYDNRPYVDTSLAINDIPCMDGDVQLEEDDLEAFLAVDGECLLLDTVRFLGSMAPDSLIKEVGIFSKAFEGVIESAQEAREEAAAAAPEVEAWVRQHILTQVVCEQTERDDRTVRRPNKM